MSAKILRKSQASMYLLGTGAQIYTIANLKVLFPVLYMVALPEPKLNENSEHNKVAMYQNMLHV